MPMPRILDRIMATTTVAVAVAAGSLAVAAPASADPESCFAAWDRHIWNARSSEAGYCKDGEWLGVLDYRADGYSARASVQLYHTGTGAWQDTYNCFDDTSQGNSGAWSWCNFSIAEGTLVRIHLWSQRNGVISDEKFSSSIAT
jgi:hypothetical protein